MYDAVQTILLPSPNTGSGAWIRLRAVGFGTMGSYIPTRLPLGLATTRGDRREANRMTNRRLATNRVLAAIPTKDYQRFRAQLEPVTLTLGQILYEPGQAIRMVYFPVDCLISLLTAVDKRRTLEVGMVGNEGMVGMPFILGIGVSGVRALVQGGGEALRMASTAFRVEFDRSRPLQQALFRYTYALMAQISQTAACNRFHEAEARLARWLLMTRERVGSDSFPLTHEFLAHMLGLRREGITEAAVALKRRKLISYSRGKMQILDVRGLKASSCSCYQVVNTVYERAELAA
jgi:CRP-like cAMP-binding protein